MNQVLPTITKSSTGSYWPTTVQGSPVPGSDVFMEMMLAQLRHQNPLEPLKDNEMLSQFSQLNSLQALVGMKDLLSEIASFGQVGYAAGLIGRQVRATREDGSSLEGTVNSVSFENGKVWLVIGHEKATLDSLIEVKLAEADELVDQDAQAEVIPESGEETL